jgi:hypothetical protein
MAARLSGGVVAPSSAAATTDAAPGSLVTEVEQLKEVVGPLHHFATVELKRLIAEYTNALLIAHLDAVR